jgi:hypothetical protein
VSLGLVARASRVVIPCLPPSFADDDEAQLGSYTQASARSVVQTGDARFPTLANLVVTRSRSSAREPAASSITQRLGNLALTRRRHKLRLKTEFGHAAGVVLDQS